MRRSGQRQWVYFGSNRIGRWEVWKQPVHGGPATQVTRDGGQVALEAPDGQSLYYTKSDIDGLWRRPVGAGPEIQVLDQLRTTDWGNWMVVEGGIYFVDRSVPMHTAPNDAERGATLAYYDFATGTHTSLVHTVRPIANPGVAVAPDGAYVLYVQVDHSEADLMMAVPLE